MPPNFRRAAQRISRRRLLATGSLALSVLAVGTSSACARGGASDSTPAAEPSPSPVEEQPRAQPSPTANQPRAEDRASPLRRTVIGRSQGGRPITVNHLGDGRRRVLLLGGQHGAPEANSVRLTDAILAHFMQHEGDIPDGIGLDIITVANPDGYISGSRLFLSGVDPNRNWASDDWESDAYDSVGHFEYGLGGPFPMSEPETRHLASWISHQRPILVVNYHSAGGFVSTIQEGMSLSLTEVYAAESGYPSHGPEGSPFGYEVTGAVDGWLAERGIADIFVELTTPTDFEIDENLAGLQAVLARLATRSHQPETEQ